MKSKFFTIIMSLVIILNIAVIGILLLIVMGEFQGVNISNTVQDFVTDFSKITYEENVIEKIEIPENLNNPLSEIQSMSDYKNNIENQEDISNIRGEKYFYNQLNNYSKTIYKAIESNKENMKTGTYKIQLGTSFSEILSKSNGKDLLGDYYQAAIEAYTYDNPDVFYLSPSKMYLNIETTTRGTKVTYNVFINSGKESNYLSKEFNTKEQIDIAISKLEYIKNEIVKNKKGTTYENIKMVHNYLVENIEYDTTISKENIYNIYGALVNGQSVCEGYAKSFKYLMDALNIPCSLVIGKGINQEGNTENHAWSYVQIEGKWYAIDVTWDDPVIIGNGTIGAKRKYKYFLKGSQEFNKDHTPIGTFTENGMEFTYPELSNDDYNK